MTEIILDSTMHITDTYLFETITEAVQNSFPESLHQKLAKPETRKQMLIDFGENAFLDPENLKYPVINPFTEQIDCRLVKAAEIRASQYHESDIIEKAKIVYNDNNCNSSIKIKIAEESIDLEDIFNFFDLTESSKNIAQNKGEYQKIVQNTMKKYNIKKISDLKDQKTKKKFFDELDAAWVTKREQDNPGKD